MQMVSVPFVESLNKMKCFDKTFGGYEYKEIKIDKLFKILVNTTTTIEKLKKLNELLNENFQKLDDFKGVYIFCLTDNFVIPDNFFDDTRLYKKDKDDYVLDIASNFNEVFESEKCLKKNHLLYVGMKKENIFSRIKEHLTNNKINGCRSLKLGFDTRKDILKKIICYIVLECDEGKISKIESDIASHFGTYFGDHKSELESEKVDSSEQYIVL